MTAQPPFAEGKRLFKDIPPTHDEDDLSSARHAPPVETAESETRNARNFMIWTLSAFVAFWAMLFATYMVLR